MILVIRLESTSYLYCVDKVIIVINCKMKYQYLIEDGVDNSFEKNNQYANNYENFLMS